MLDLSLSTAPEYAIAGAKQRDLRRSAPPGKRRSVMVSRDRERDRETVTEYVMCCHCGRHWQYQVGSGRLRGFCLRCNDITCGPLCPVGDNCVPVQQFLENLERGLTLQEACRHRPISVSAGGVLLGKK